MYICSDAQPHVLSPKPIFPRDASVSAVHCRAGEGSMWSGGSILGLG